MEQDKHASILIIRIRYFYNHFCFYCKKRKNNDYTDYNQITPIKNTEKCFQRFLHWKHFSARTKLGGKFYENIGRTI